MELSNEKTPVTTKEMAEAFVSAWKRYFGEYPKAASIKLLLAHWALETGWGKSMHAYNVGNAKCTDKHIENGYHHQYFACNELLSPKSAEKYLTDPRAKVTKKTPEYWEVWFYPDHPACRFLAFKTLEDGVLFYLKLLATRFFKSWPSVLSGDPEQFSKSLRKQGYYTADESQYTNTICKIYRGLVVEVPAEGINVSEVQAQVSSSLQKMVDDICVRTPAKPLDGE